METATKAGDAKSIDEYIARFPKPTQMALQEVRAAIRQAAHRQAVQAPTRARGSARDSLEGTPAGSAVS